jgi:hypothetical protein
MYSCMLLLFAWRHSGGQADVQSCQDKEPLVASEKKLIFRPGQTSISPGSDCSCSERSGINPVLRPALSLAQLQPSPDRAIHQTVAGNLIHYWLMMLSGESWFSAVVVAADEPSDRTWDKRFIAVRIRQVPNTLTINVRSDRVMLTR